MSSPLKRSLLALSLLLMALPASADDGPIKIGVSSLPAGRTVSFRRRPPAQRFSGRRIGPLYGIRPSLSGTRNRAGHPMITDVSGKGQQYAPPSAAALNARRISQIPPSKNGTANETQGSVRALG